MPPPDWQKVKEVYNDALEQPQELRAAYVSEACGGDADLRGEVVKLLAADQESEDFFGTLDRTLEAGLRGRTPESPWLGRTLGGYTLFEVAGRGGMGTVFRGRPDDGGELVAVKVLDLQTASVISQKRFVLEQEGLRRLEHPNIAGFRSGGEAPDGTPYFVMDLVEGLTIDRFADERALSVQDRVRLLLPICDAVSHAHARDIIHRDIKPSNILVTAEGKPVLLDLGLAKLLDPVRRGEPTELTLAGRSYTPLYSSPEQMDGRTVVPASDVYSLGAVLIRLLCGFPPVPIPDQSPEPAAIFAKRRTKQQGLAALRSTSVEELTETLRGPLGRVAARACHATTALRYASIDELVADLNDALAPESRSAPQGLWTDLRRWFSE